MVIYSKGGHRKMLRHVSFKNWNPIGKTYGHKNRMLDSMENKSINEEKITGKEKKDRKKDLFGEAATLELSQDYVRTVARTTRVLKLGTSGDDVKKLQENLNALGYNTGTPDGKFGNNTQNAVILFQKVYGLDADGKAGSATQNAINTAINRKNKNILAKGQISNDVKNLQNDLKTLGFLSGSVDGKFGSGTETAVKAFQQKYGLTPDGLVGNTTKAKLAEVKAGNQTKPVNPTPSDKGTVRNVSLDMNYINKNVNQENAKYVYNELIKAGFTKQSAAAVMGNLDVENAFKTTWDGDQNSVGIAQWRNDRRNDLEKYAAEHNGDKTDIKIQTAYMIEVDLKKRLGDEGLKKLKSMTDYIDATDYFCDKFESPSSYKNHDEWLNGKYGPNYKQHGGKYEIKWERYEWSDQLQKYELDLKKRRSASRYWYNTMG